MFVPVPFSFVWALLVPRHRNAAAIFRNVSVAVVEAEVVIVVLAEGVQAVSLAGFMLAADAFNVLISNKPVATAAGA